MSELRISGGSLRGRKLEVPGFARPTEGRVREALFSILGSAVQGARVLDLFAGSGAVAFEALSRGASQVDLVDASRATKSLLSRSRDRLGIPEKQAQVHRLVLPATLPFPPHSFDLVFADPPYEFSLLSRLLAIVTPVIAESGWFVLEHSSRIPPPAGQAELVLLRTRIYGGSALSIYRADVRA